MEELIKVRGTLTRKIKAFNKCLDEKVKFEVLKFLYDEIATVVSAIEIQTEEIMRKADNKDNILENELFKECRTPKGTNICFNMF